MSNVLLPISHVEAVHSVGDLSQDDLRVFMVSTNGTRRALTDPTIAGDAYMTFLQQAATAFFRSKHWQALIEGAERHIHTHDEGQRLTDKNINILNILRGGLSYSLRQALASVGVTRPRSSFISAQRNEIAAGLFRVDDASYTKITLSKIFPSIVLMADVVASGTTLRYCLRNLARECREGRLRVTHIVLMCVGCDNAIKILQEEANTLMREACPDFLGSVCVYYEGIFTLSSSVKLHNQTTGTDLVLSNSRLTEEFRHYVTHETTSIFAMLQKCVQYDGANRAFSVAEHFDEVHRYFRGMRDLIRKGQLTPLELLHERWEQTRHCLSEQCQQELSDSQAFLSKLERYLKLLELEMNI
eukprot:TRINITY_DN2852_c0_g2_i1.p1 TRINITY_DN2852_c0_g2~~TRINITY_DN2852_c0_g2_i1.p1  ORF type:complete len:358 (-),score=67.14 TRINITY_DN2852_c0_g2_i1:207-1280(-)